MHSDTGAPKGKTNVLITKTKMLTWKHKLALTQEVNHEEEQKDDMEIQNNAELVSSEPKTDYVEQR